ncbi:hypothetical protein P8452_41459 [Trifolium repens]|nr:hypothetical protein P8452_41459 [Trifolium repens]
MKKEDHFDVNFSVVEEHVVHGIDDQHMLIQISMPSILEALTHLVTKVRLTAFKMLEQVLNIILFSCILN